MKFLENALYCAIYYYFGTQFYAFCMNLFHYYFVVNGRNVYEYTLYGYVHCRFIFENEKNL